MNNTGGSAFPVPDDAADMKGMTLRDYFAAKAMQVFYMNLTGEESKHPDSVAFWCYSMADAMLKAREE